MSWDPGPAVPKARDWRALALKQELWNARTGGGQPARPSNQQSGARVSNSVFTAPGGGAGLGSLRPRLACRVNRSASAQSTTARNLRTRYPATRVSYSTPSDHSSHACLWWSILTREGCEISVSWICEDVGRRNMLCTCAVEKKKRCESRTRGVFAGNSAAAKRKRETKGHHQE